MENSAACPIPLLLLFFFMFFTIYLVAYFIVFRNWSPNIRPESSSCFISLAHGTPAVLLSTFSILADSNRGFASPNTDPQNLVLDFSIAYFLMDLLHYIVFFPKDVLFIAHHLATLFVFVTCRYLVSHGAYAILVLLILAELTSACQNAWTLANARKNDVAFAAKLKYFEYHSCHLEPRHIIWNEGLTLFEIKVLTCARPTSFPHELVFWGC